MAALLANVPFTIIATGALVGVAASLLGTFLVLRRSSMLADAISHSIVFGIAIVWLLTRLQSGPLQIVGAAATGVLTVYLIEALTSSRKVKGDAAIGLVFPALFAVGVLLLNLYAREVHVDAHTVLLGEIGFVWLDTVAVGGVEVARALLSMGVLAFLNLAFVLLFYKELKLATFDETLARSLGFYPGLLFYALLTLTSSTAVAAFDAVGAILFVAFVIVPPAAAYLLTDRLWRMLLYSALIALTASPVGYYLAVRWDVSIGGMMALVTGAFLLLAFLLGPRHGLLAQEATRRRQRQRNDRRALVVHLYNHEATAVRRQENVTTALPEHLRWGVARARRAVAQSLARGLIDDDDGYLRLTETGRELAREVLEPWRRGGG